MVAKSLGGGPQTADKCNFKSNNIAVDPMWFVILSAAKYLYFRTVQRFFTFVQNDKFAYCIDEGATAMLSPTTEVLYCPSVLVGAVRNKSTACDDGTFMFPKEFLLLHRNFGGGT